MAGISSKAATTLANKLKYNGKEEQRQEFSDGSGLELYDYGARMYDAQVGRWFAIDIMSEAYSPQSAYAYVSNNPIKNIDVHGMFELGYGLLNNPKYKEIVDLFKSDKMASLIHNQHLMDVLKSRTSEEYVSNFNKAIRWDKGKIFLNNPNSRYDPVINASSLGIWGNAQSSQGANGRLYSSLDYSLFDNYLSAAKEDKDAAFLVIVHTVFHEFIHGSGLLSDNGAWGGTETEPFVQGVEREFWDKYSNLPHTNEQHGLSKNDGKKYFDTMMAWAKDVLRNLRSENQKKINDARGTMGSDVADFLQKAINANPLLEINVR